MTLRRCYVCKLELPLDAFPVITVRDKRCKPGHTWTGPAYDCRECRKQQRREWRRKKAEEAGKPFVPRGDRAAYEERCRIAREERRAKGLLRAAAHNAELQRLARQRRDRLLASARLTCSQCGATKDRAEFHVSVLEGGDAHCKACVSARDASQFRRDRQSLSDSYVKRQIAKRSGLSRKAIPQVLIEAKRAQLLIERVVNPKRKAAT